MCEDHFVLTTNHRRSIMDEKNAVIKFWKAANENNEQAARNALKHISRETINAQDDDGYTMLITAIQNENLCAIRALLASGQCDMTLRENLCGMTAKDYAEDFPKNSPIRKAFDATATIDVGDERV